MKLLFTHNGAQIYSGQFKVYILPLLELEYFFLEIVFHH